MAISSPSRGLRPGVCTSTTRPANPYDGMVIYETDTDKVAVYDASAWVYKTGTTAPTAPGLVCVKAETALSGTSVIADNVFSSDYSNYLILLRYTTVGNNEIAGRLRAGGVSASGANYNSQNISSVTTNPAAIRVNTTSQQLATASNGDFKSSAVIHLFSPAIAEPTNFQIANNPSLLGYTGVRLYIWMANHAVATAYDGIEFFTAINMTGTYAIYGYAKTV